MLYLVVNISVCIFHKAFILEQMSRHLSIFVILHCYFCEMFFFKDCAIAVSTTFVTTLVILAFLICRANRYFNTYGIHVILSFLVCRTNRYSTHTALMQYAQNTIFYFLELQNMLQLESQRMNKTSLFQN